jgi:hypothetical protein
MADAMLPAEFADLEPYAATWCLPTEPERYAQRLRSSMDEMLAFYEPCFARFHDAVAYCDKFPLDEMPDDAMNLLHLLYSLVTVSFPVEVWHQPNVVDSGAAYLDLVSEPTP